MSKPQLSLICPAYYDEHNIAPLARLCIETLESACEKFEIIIVEDGSPDGTGGVADKLASEFSFIRVFHHEHNRGHGAAIKTGMFAARYPLIALLDGDGQYDPRDILSMLSRIEDCDVVQGSRPYYPNGFLRLLLSRAYNIIVRCFFNVSFKDLGCSIKLIKKDVAEKYTPGTDGIFAQGEMILRANHSGCKVVEMDVKSFPRATGRSSSISGRNIVIVLSDIFRLKKEFEKR